MRFPFRKIALYGILGSFLFALVFLALYLILPVIFGANNTIVLTLKSVFAILAMLLIIISALIPGAIMPLLGIVEVATSKNDSIWKIIWIVILFFLSWLGLLAYVFIARKDLKG